MYSKFLKQLDVGDFPHFSVTIQIFCVVMLLMFFFSIGGCSQFPLSGRIGIHIDDVELKSGS